MFGAEFSWLAEGLGFGLGLATSLILETELHLEIDSELARSQDRNAGSRQFHRREIAVSSNDSYNLA